MEEGADLVVLPEYFTYLGPEDRYGEVAEVIDGPTLSRVGALAAKHGIVVLAGSLIEPSPHAGKFFNTSVLFGPDGARLGVYRKIHLFDVEVGDGQTYRESAAVAPGTEVVVADSPLGKVGLSVVPAMVAVRLGINQATFAGELSVDGGAVTIRRDSDVASEKVTAALPAIVSVTDQTGEARYPSFKGIMAAKKKDVQEWTLSDLDIDAASVGLDNAWTKVESFEPRPPRTAGEIVTDEGDGGTKLAEFLASKKFI